MNEIKIEDLYQINYSAKVLNALKQKWSDDDSYDFIGNKKKQHLLLCLLNCSAIYTLKDGTQIIAPHNSIVYTPEESEYKIRFTDCNASEDYNCISINFKLYDDKNIPFCFDNGIKIYTVKKSSHILQSFHDVADNCQYAIVSPMKIAGLFYVLLSDISKYYRTKNNILSKYNVIAKGIETLESNCTNDITINDLAKLCNVSPIYFRRLFKEYSGTTPMEYKLNSIIEQAKQHLIFSNKQINEIADILGFSSPTYFCRIFKKKTGITPMQYIKIESDNA